MGFAALKLWREGGQVLAQWDGQADRCQIPGAVLEVLAIPKYWGQVFAIGEVDMQIVGYQLQRDLYECKHLPKDDEDTIDLLRN